MSSFSIKTSTMQSLVNKVVKAAGNSNFNTLTNLVHVELTDNVLTLTTTDLNNYFTMVEKDVTGENLEFTVPCEIFQKLIAKTSTENIKFDVSDDVIAVTGNGTYKIQIQLDVDGKPIKYPKNTINNPDHSGTVKLSYIKNIILHNKTSCALTDEEPCLKGYFCTDGGVVSADSFNICKTTLDMFDTSILVSPLVFDLLSMSSSEDVSYKICDNRALFESDNIVLFSHLMDGVDKYASFLETINSCVDTKYPSSCSVSKTLLMSSVDRLSLFIDDTDQNAIRFTFTKNGISLESMNSRGIETVPYQGSDNFSDFTCLVGVDALKRQMQSISGESVKIEYGDSKIIAIKKDNSVHVISLMTDGSEEE